MSDKVRYKIVFSGRVQGVGFRFKAQYTASAYGLTGFVKNEYDGTVLMEVQGEKIAIDLFIQKLMADRYIHVSDMDKESIPVEDAERNFGIQY